MVESRLLRQTVFSFSKVRGSERKKPGRVFAMSEPSPSGRLRAVCAQVARRRPGIGRTYVTVVGRSSVTVRVLSAQGSGTELGRNPRLLYLAQ